MPMKIMMGPIHSAIAVTPDCVIACHHATNFFTTASILNLDGTPWVTGWKRERWGPTDTRDVRACDFNFVVKREVDDIDYCLPLFPIPTECLTQLHIAAAGDNVVVESVRLNLSVAAKLEAIFSNRAVCDFAALSGDSGSLVWSTTVPRRFVGFIVGGKDGKSSIAIPDTAQVAVVPPRPSTGPLAPNSVIPAPTASAVTPTATTPVATAPTAPAPTVTAPVAPAQTAPALTAPALTAPALTAPALNSLDKAAAVRIAGEALGQAITGCTDGRARSMALTHLEIALLIVGNAVSPAPTLVAPQ